MTLQNSISESLISSQTDCIRLSPPSISALRYLSKCICLRVCVYVCVGVYACRNPLVERWSACRQSRALQLTGIIFLYKPCVLKLESCKIKLFVVLTKKNKLSRKKTITQGLDYWFAADTPYSVALQHGFGSQLWSMRFGFQDEVFQSHKCVDLAEYWLLVVVLKIKVADSCATEGCCNVNM